MDEPINNSQALSLVIISKLLKYHSKARAGHTLIHDAAPNQRGYPKVSLCPVSEWSEEAE